jgi:uncharacterized protein YacL
MGLLVLRCIFVMVAIGLGVLFIRSPVIPTEPAWLSYAVFGGTLFISLSVIVLDISIRKKHLDTITAVYFGLLVGLFLTYVLSLALTPIFTSPAQLTKDEIKVQNAVQNAIQLILGLVLCYICISLLMQTKNDFSFIIPYVEFAKEVKGLRPCLLDTSVIIDGRIADVVETNIFDSKLVIPKFVISELQAIADSSDRLRRARGRRGLDILNRLRTNPQIDLEIYEHELPEYADQSVDLKLVILAKHLQGKLVTNDYNLNKVARVQGVPVLNFNDLANALKPVFLPGEHIEVRIIKVGEEPGQGVGYLEDGTMVVIEGGRDHVSETVQIAVTSVLQTSAGRMVFGRYESSC